MRHILALLLLTTPLAAQGIDGALGGHGFAVDAGLGVQYGPSYLGADDGKATPWLIWRHARLTRPGAVQGQPADGFSLLPSMNYIGKRKPGAHDNLEGMDKIGAAGELGLRLRYDAGPAEGYLTLRKGFGGHDGFVGELGAKYRIAAADRLSIWTGTEARFGNDDFTRTYFGVSDDEAMTSAHAAYQPDGGFYAASLGLGARYAVTPDFALMGEVEYIRLLGDAADSPLVVSKGEPRVKLGLVRHFDFRF